MSRRPDARILVALAVLLAAVAVAAFRVSGSSAPRRTGSSGAAALTRNDPAPALAGLTRWFNGPPTTLAALRGKIVLVDFWTYSCINCIRTFPEIRALHQTYRDAGLVVLGIHSPEFSFEKDPRNVERAVADHRVTWPVAMDNDMKTWTAFGNHYWPHVYLIDAKGRIRFDRIGEGGGVEIERAIRALLQRSGAPLPPPANPDVEEPSDGITPEIYLGYLRGEPAAFLGNASGYVHDSEAAYSLPSEGEIAGGHVAFFLDGRWRATDESIVAGAAGVRLVLPFGARKVFVVAGPGAGPGSADVEVLLDGVPIDSARAGANVAGSSLRLSYKALYEVVSLDRVESHELTLRPRGPGAVFFSFTFG